MMKKILVIFVLVCTPATWGQQATSNQVFDKLTVRGDINGVVMADQQAGTDASIKINACRTAALALAPHVCDARNLGGTQTISQEIDVGDSAQDPFTLILPSQGKWNVTITNGTSCAIKQFSQSVMMGATPGGAPRLIIQPLNSSTSVKQYYCTDPNPAGGGSYIRASDFMIYNPSVAATTQKTAMRIYALFDNSTYTNITVADYMERGIQIRGSCCSASFYNLTSNGGHGAGAQPLFLDAVGGLNGELTLNFFGGSFDHPGSGLRNIFIQGNGATAPLIANFYGTYMEGNNSDTTTPLVEVQSVSNVNFTGVTACTMATASTAPVFQLDASPVIASQFSVTGLSIPTMLPCKHRLPEPKAILNNITVPTTNIASDANGNLGSYSTGIAIFAGVTNLASVKSCRGANPCSNTQQNNGLNVYDGGAVYRLSGGTLTVTGFPFSASNTFGCFAWDVTNAANKVTVVNNSGARVTFTGTMTDTFRFFCTGN